MLFVKVNLPLPSRSINYDWPGDGGCFARYLRISGCLTMVVAPIIIGNKGKHGVIGDISRDNVNQI